MVSVRCGDVVGVSVYFEDQEEAARVLLHALAQLHAIAAARSGGDGTRCQLTPLPA